MATKYYYISGPTKWAKVFKPDDKYNNFQVPLYLNDSNMKLFKEMNLSLKVREDEDGTFVTFKRPMTKLIKGEAVTLGAPKVLDSSNQPLDKTIGNGSIVTLKVAVYDTIKGPGHTLESVRVEKLVEYVKPEEGSTLPGTPPKATGGPSLPF
jgi:hypothetical protein